MPSPGFYAQCLLAMLGVLPVNICQALETQARPRSVVGAIRWDAWHGDAGYTPGAPETPGMSVERSLGPQHWHYRLPFYATVLSEQKVEVRGNSQKVMDQELACASAAGLDYWAFLTYAPDSPMSQGLKFYLSSATKAKLKFCLICHHIRENDLNVALFSW